MHAIATKDSLGLSYCYPVAFNLAYKLYHCNIFLNVSLTLVIIESA
jgi:hypothetical protein